MNAKKNLILDLQEYVMQNPKVFAQMSVLTPMQIVNILKDFTLSSYKHKPPEAKSGQRKVYTLIADQMKAGERMDSLTSSQAHYVQQKFRRAGKKAIIRKIPNVGWAVWRIA